MHKIWLIIKREYLVRVRKKSFIVMTILGPLLMASLMIVPIYLASESQEERIIAVNQQEEFILENTEFLHFTTLILSTIHSRFFSPPLRSFYLCLFFFYA